MNQNTTRIVIVVLVIVVVIFFVGVGIGAGGGNNGQGGLPGLSVDSVINSFGGLLPAPAVAVSEIDASPSGCFNPNLQRITVPLNGSCTLEIADSDANIRALKLTLLSGSVHIESTSDPVEDKPLETKSDLPDNGSAQLTLNFFKKNSSVTFSNCTVGGGCALDVTSSS